MAQVTKNLTALDHFERRLATAIGDWEQLPEMAAEWGDWDIDSQMDFLTDWPVVEERTSALLHMEAALPPNDARVVKLRALRVLVERSRPILEELETRIHEK